jgi:hypothetical protein
MYTTLFEGTEKVKNKKQDTSKPTNKTIDNGFINVLAPQVSFNDSTGTSPVLFLPRTETGIPGYWLEIQFKQQTCLVRDTI